MSIGKNIRRLRESQGMSQADLAIIAGVTDKAVSTWENDLKIPRMGSIQKMAKHFGVSKSDIIEDSIGDNIQKIRISKGIEDSEVANQLGITIDLYKRYEEGIALPPPHIVGRLSTIFDVDKFEIIGWNEFELDPSETEKSPAPNSAELTDPNEDHLISNYRSLDSQKQNSLIDYSDYLKNQM